MKRTLVWKWLRTMPLTALLLAVCAILLILISLNFRQARDSNIAFTASGGFRVDGEYPSSGIEVVRGTRWASWSGSDANTGYLSSAPFTAPHALALTIDGYPSHPGESIELEDANRQSERVRLNVGPDVGETWTPRIVQVPAEWRGRNVRLIAVDNGKAWGDWIGLADLRPARPLETLFNIVMPDNPGAFFVVAYAALAAFLALTFWRTASLPFSAAVRERVYCAAITVVLFAWRWPVLISANHALNPDEGSMIANALKATIDLVPWRGFDGYTSGPLNSDVLALAALVGAHIDFFSARFIGLLLVAGALCALYVAIRWSYDADIARICVAPPVLMLAFVRGVGFVHYSSEHLSVFLTSVALACAAFIASGRGSERGRLWVAAAAGVFVGCTPFAKLQAIPIAFAVFLYVIAAIARTRYAARKRLSIELTAAFGGLAIPAVLILGTVAFAGEWNDFFISYLRSAAAYVANGEAITATSFFQSDRQYTSFLESAIAACLASVALLVVFRTQVAKIAPLAPVSSVVLLLASLFAIYEPHRPFPWFDHYLLLSILPIAWLAANLFAMVYKAVPSASLRAAVSAAYVVLFALPAFFQVTATQDNFVKDIAVNATFPKSAVATAIGHYVPRGGRIAIWGWMPQYYVESGTIMATRDAQTQQQIDPSALREYFRDRFVSDITASRPQLIVDAVGPAQFAYTDNATEGIDSFPRLASLVHLRYVLAKEVAGVRIFRLRDMR